MSLTSDSEQCSNLHFCIPQFFEMQYEYGTYGQIMAIKGKYAQIRVIMPKYAQI